MTTIQIPYKFTPRPYQIDLYNCLPNGYKRGVVVFHRRAGKDKTLINIIAREMLKTKGTYYYFFPTYTQAKKVIWNGMDRDGFKFLDHIPQEIRIRTNDSEMLIEIKNGSIFQLIGSDDYDKIVGTNPIGCVFSEYALQNPAAWEYIRPILTENKGWALFASTPRGENHFYDLYEMAKNNKDWFCQKLTIDDTRDDLGNPIITKKQIDAERRDGMSEEMILQEFYCNFSASAIGSYYGSQLRLAEQEGRIANVPHETGLPVETWWDLGMRHSTPIWFSQTIGKEIRLIDYYEASGEGLAHYAKILGDKPYVYKAHHAPHDIEVRELGTGKSRIEVARALGINFRLVPNLGFEDGIEAVRNIFSRCWFDKTKCAPGLKALKNYRKDYDDKRKVFRSYPVDDWCADSSDAFRYLAVGFKVERIKKERKYQPVRVVNPLTGY